MRSVCVFGFLYILASLATLFSKVNSIFLRKRKMKISYENRVSKLVIEVFQIIQSLVG